VSGNSPKSAGTQPDTTVRREDSDGGVFYLPLVPPRDLDVEKTLLSIAIDIVGVPAITKQTMPELYRRLLIWERLTEPFWSRDTDRPALLRKYLGLRIDSPGLSAAAFKRKVLAKAWELAENDAAEHRTRRSVPTRALRSSRPPGRTAKSSDATPQH
jgi:hypothetical protein